MVLEESFGVLLAFSAAIAWGSASVLSKSVLNTEHSLTEVMVIRGIFAVPFIGGWAILTLGIESILLLFRADLILLVSMSAVFVGIGDLSFFRALQRVEVSKVQPVTGIYPVFTAVTLFLFGVEAIGSAILFGTFLIVFGVALVSSYSSSVQKQASSIQTLGLALAIVAAFFWSLAILTVRVILENPEVQVLGLATVRFGLMTVIMGGLWAIETYRHPQSSKSNASLSLSITRREAIVLGIGGLITWGIGGVFFFYSIDMIGAARATPISSINPLIAVLLGVVVLKERLTRIQALGILLVCLGAIFISFV